MLIKDIKEFNPRIKRALLRYGMVEIEDLNEYSVSRLLMDHNYIGDSSINTIILVCKSYGIVLKDDRKSDGKIDASKARSYNRTNKYDIQSSSLSTKVRNALKRKGIYDLRSLSEYTAEQISMIPGIGKLGYEELMNACAEVGVYVKGVLK